MKHIQRDSLLQSLQEVNNTPDIKIISGVRRSGKSQLLMDYIEWIQTNENDANVILVDLRQLAYEPLCEYHALHEYVENRYKAGAHNVLCIDEVQMCHNFELAINSLHSMGKYDIYLTGSNAFLLSSDLATLFTGRYILLEVFPFSFKEYLIYFGESGDIQALFDQYLIMGGFSGSYVYQSVNKRTQYIKDVYATILQRDLVDKYHLADNHILFQLGDFLMDNVSNISSPYGISQELNRLDISTNNHTISNYIDYLCKAYVFYQVNRYDLRGKKYLQSLNKFYLVDTSLRYAVLGTRNMDWGRMYENIVFIELKRRGYEVYVGKLYQKEIDFVAMRGNEKIFIQVSDDLSNPETFKREYAPLLQIKEAYPKMIIARTRHLDYDYQGIMIKDLAHWLQE
ncbi:MAG: ATP-binding protein [Paludibacteraceae bacterium]|nr:ATP-binding protein [Paludibacteraceae bacterium]